MSKIKKKWTQTLSMRSKTPRNHRSRTYNTKRISSINKVAKFMEFAPPNFLNMKRRDKELRSRSMQPKSLSLGQLQWSRICTREWWWGFLVGSTHSNTFLLFFFFKLPKLSRWSKSHQEGLRLGCLRFESDGGRGGCPNLYGMMLKYDKNPKIIGLGQNSCHVMAI